MYWTNLNPGMNMSDTLVLSTGCVKKQHSSTICNTQNEISRGNEALHRQKAITLALHYEQIML